MAHCGLSSGNYNNEATLLFDGEVDDRGFGGDLGGVVRVAEFGRDVEAEVGVVLHFLVAKFDEVAATWEGTTTKDT